MYVVQRVFARPSTSVDFYKSSSEFNSHLTATYITTGKLSQNKTVSPDGLKMTVTMIWGDQASFAEYEADPVCAAHFTARNDYNTANGITADRTATEV